MSCHEESRVLAHKSQSPIVPTQDAPIGCELEEDPPGRIAGSSGRAHLRIVRAERRVLGRELLLCFHAAGRLHVHLGDLSDHVDRLELSPALAPLHQERGPGVPPGSLRLLGVGARAHVDLPLDHHEPDGQHDRYAVGSQGAEDPGMGPFDEVPRLFGGEAYARTRGGAASVMTAPVHSVCRCTPQCPSCVPRAHPEPPSRSGPGTGHR